MTIASLKPILDQINVILEDMGYDVDVFHPDVELYPDSEVTNCWALKDEFGTVFVINLDQEAVWEDCDFDTWPPRSGELKFFL